MRVGSLSEMARMCLPLAPPVSLSEGGCCISALPYSLTVWEPLLWGTHSWHVGEGGTSRGGVGILEWARSCINQTRV